MAAVKLAVFRNHFRLKPYSETHSVFFAYAYNIVEPVRELVFINIPIPERGIIAFSAAEPAVIQNKCINSEAAAAAHKVFYALFGNIKIHSLPTVNNYGVLYGFLG